MQPRERVPYSAIVDRPPLKLPGGARIVIWTIVNIFFHVVLGVFLAVLYPLMQWTWIGWIIYGVGIAATIGVALRLRSRYRLSILDSSSLGVVTWLQRRL